MTWVAIAVSSAAVAGVLTIIDKQLVSKYLNYFPSFGLLLGLSSVVWGTVTCILFPLSSDISTRELLIAFSSGLIWSASLVLHMFVLKTGEASRVSPVFNTYPAIVAILGVSFLGESLVWFGWLAILSTITGAIMVSIKQKPDIKVIAVSMKRGPSMYESLKAGKPVDVIEEETLADCLGGSIGLENKYTFNIVKETVDDFVLLDEGKIAEGIKFNFESHKIITEGAAATSAMVVKDHLSEFIGTNVVCLVCGGNIDSKLFTEIIS